MDPVSIAPPGRACGGALRVAVVVAALLAALSGTAGPAAAQTAGAPASASAPPAGQTAALPAIGRILTGGPDGTAACTGALVAPSLVLTAGHCFVRRDGNPRAAGEFHFATGRTEGAPGAVRKGRVVRFAAGGPTFFPTSADVALLELWGEVPAAVAAPLPVRAAGAADPPFAFAAFVRGGRAPGAVWSGACGVPRELGGGALGIGCEAVSGNSGAPLLGRSGADWVVVGVVSARVPGEGPVRTIAVRPPPDVLAAIAAAAAP